MARKLPDGPARGQVTLMSPRATIERMPSVDDVEDALTNVIDPELGLDFVELGLIYGVEVDGGDVHVTFTLTSPGCPIGPQVTEQIDEFVSELDGVDVGRVHDDLHAAVDAGPHERRREVRARLLTDRRVSDLPRARRTRVATALRVTCVAAARAPSARVDSEPCSLVARAPAACR